MMQATLSTLRDIEGVLGSFFVDDEGRVLARDMPGVFDDATLKAAGLRLARLRSALETDEPAFGGCAARFGQHLLVLKPVATRTLCVLVPRDANLTALSMGTTLVARRLVGASPEPVAPAFDLRPPTQPPIPAQPAPAQVDARGSAREQNPVARTAPLPSVAQPLPAPRAAQAVPEPAPERQPTRRLFRGRPVS